MNYKEEYNKWLGFDEQTRSELLSIKDEKEIEDRFYKNLKFGTGGLRGIMGAGANRMNKYTVSKATQGLADYLNNEFSGKKSVAIAFDSRNNSQQFALYCAEVLARNNIKAYLYMTLQPTPVLSFTVRYLKCTAGIVITASHNPKEYNGYKIYDSEGCQLVPEYANKVIKYVEAVEDIGQVGHMSADEAIKAGLLEFIGNEIVDEFIKEVEKQSIYREKNNLKIVYTPLHGTGNIPVRTVLKDFDVTVEESQEKPDGNFSTVRSPNPEEKDALDIAIKKAESIKADLVLGTDPDCDRVGTAVLHNGEYKLITGNQMGALLVDFVLSHKKSQLNSKSTLVKTIVTNSLGADIAKSFGLKIEETLTGFKYIGDKINRYEKEGNNEFVIGYEESYGYLVGTHSRDKDAVVSSMLICEMAAYHKNNGMTLIDALEKLYSEYGYFLDSLDAFVLKGKEGSEKINAIMSHLRETGNNILPDIVCVYDYSQGINGLPRENVLKFIFKNGSWIAARPSGTEPKLKIYYSICSSGREQCKQLLDTYKDYFKKLIED
ncbi:MAG: phospho-sugar mutase [Clostridia bacterium]|nr:phospho-sugar mutase [Clostridia bacterium]